MHRGLQDKHALVTGAARGLGRAIAAALAAAGCRLLATDIDNEALGEISDQLHGCPTARLDVRETAAIGTVLDDLDRLDILVNCAGTILRDNQEFAPQGFEDVVDVNLHGTMRMCYASRDLLVASRGCILNIASMLSMFGSGYSPAYSASKGGIAQLTKSLAIAWASDGIRVNAIAPGWFKTELTSAVHEDPARHDAIVGRTPLGRWGEPQDVCGAALFLCSPAAAFITGVVLPVDGGYSVT